MKKTVVLFLIALMFLVGCQSNQAAYELVREESTVLGGSAPAADQSQKSDGFNAQEGLGEIPQQERLVIKDGSLSIVVDDPVHSLEAISSMAEDLGGYVVRSNLSQVRTENGLEVPQANLTIRVPAERMDEALGMIKSGAGRVLSEQVTGQDVTQEYTDLGSRLRNLENAEKELTRIMEEAEDTEDVLNVYNRLVDVQEQIEVIKGQMQYFERSAAMSSISITIQADEAVQPLQIGGWQPAGVAKRALQALINTMTFFGDAAIWIALYLLPVLLVLMIPVVVAWRVLREILRRRKARKANQAEEEGSQGA
mgnify:FL=1